MYRDKWGIDESLISVKVSCERLPQSLRNYILKKV